MLRELQNECHHLEQGFSITEHALIVWKQAFFELAGYEIPSSLMSKLARILKLECHGESVYFDEEEEIPNTEQERAEKAL